MHKSLIQILLFFLVVYSCTPNPAKSKVVEENSDLELKCDELPQQDDYTTLTGTLVISPKGELVFRATTDDSLGIACPTFLVPCPNGNNDYLEGQYSAFSSIRDLEDDCWISLSGKYLNLDDYKKQDGDFEKLEFMYDWVALTDSPTKVRAHTILDSINSINKQDLIIINMGRKVNNHLPKESVYKLENFRRELHEIEYGIFWQADSTKYKLVRFV